MNHQTTTNDQSATSLTQEEVEFFGRQPISITLTGGAWSILVAGLMMFGAEAFVADNHESYQESEDIYCELLAQIRQAGRAYREGATK